MYVTFKKEFIEQQYTFDDLFDSLYAGTTELLTNTEPHTTYHTTTLALPMRHITPRVRTELEKMEHVLDTVMQKVTDITQEDMSEHYTTFQIPKRSGGLRRIDAPKQELMSLLSEIKDIFHYKLGALAHEQAYAYIQGRSCKMALEQHQKNASKYFAKYDVKDFFPGCTKEFILHQLQQIYPYCHLIQRSDRIQKIIDICLLNNALPQGTPMSPLLTNIIMIPFDYHLSLYFKKQNIVYTRYADDILLSKKESFNFIAMQNHINRCFVTNDAPFRLKKEKTRYGSSAGSNWNLGLMLNKDNNITLGHKKKQRIRAMIFNFLQDFTSGTNWSIMDVYELQGQISYLEHIEPAYTKAMVQKYEQKFNKNLRQCIKAALN